MHVGVLACVLWYTRVCVTLVVSLDVCVRGWQNDTFPSDSTAIVEPRSLSQHYLEALRLVGGRDDIVRPRRETSSAPAREAVSLMWLNTAAFQTSLAMFSER